MEKLYIALSGLILLDIVWGYYYYTKDGVGIQSWKTTIPQHIIFFTLFYFITIHIKNKLTFPAPYKGYIDVFYTFVFPYVHFLLTAFAQFIFFEIRDFFNPKIMIELKFTNKEETLNLQKLILNDNYEEAFNSKIITYKITKRRKLIESSENKVHGLLNSFKFYKNSLILLKYSPSKNIEYNTETRTPKINEEKFHLLMEVLVKNINNYTLKALKNFENNENEKIH